MNNANNSVFKEITYILSLSELTGTDKDFDIVSKNIETINQEKEVEGEVVGKISFENYTQKDIPLLLPLIAKIKVYTDYKLVALPSMLQSDRKLLDDLEELAEAILVAGEEKGTLFKVSSLETDFTNGNFSKIFENFKINFNSILEENPELNYKGFDFKNVKVSNIVVGLFKKVFPNFVLDNVTLNDTAKTIIENVKDEDIHSLPILNLSVEERFSFMNDKHGYTKLETLINQLLIQNPKGVILNCSDAKGQLVNHHIEFNINLAYISCKFKDKVKIMNYELEDGNNFNKCVLELTHPIFRNRGEIMKFYNSFEKGSVFIVINNLSENAKIGRFRGFRLNEDKNKPSKSYPNAEIVFEIFDFDSEISDAYEKLVNNMSDMITLKKYDLGVKLNDIKNNKMYICPLGCSNEQEEIAQLLSSLNLTFKKTESNFYIDYAHMDLLYDGKLYSRVNERSEADKALIKDLIN